MKIRKIGNSVGAIFPKEWELNDGDNVPYYIKDGEVHIQMKEFLIDQRREEIEKSFSEFERGEYVTEDKMTEEFGKYGWGK